MYDDIPTLINGQYQTEISVRDRGFCYGDGLFETALVVAQRIPFIEQHLRRLMRGCERLAIAIDAQLIEQYIAKILNDSVASSSTRERILKITVTRGVSERGYAPSADSQPNTVVQLFHKDSAPFLEQGVAVCRCTHKIPINPPLAGLKHLNRLDNVLAAREVAERSCAEGLLFDYNDNLVEAISKNIFIVKRGVLQTPLLDQCGVVGIMRQRVLENYAQALSLPVMEARLTTEDVEDADEIFLTNSIRGVWPVNRVDDKAARLGKIAPAIHALWENEVFGESLS